MWYDFWYGPMHTTRSIQRSTTTLITWLYKPQRILCCFRSPPQLPPCTTPASRHWIVQSQHPGPCGLPKDQVWSCWFILCHSISFRFPESGIWGDKASPRSQCLSRWTLPLLRYHCIFYIYIYICHYRIYISSACIWWVWYTLVYMYGIQQFLRRVKTRACNGLYPRRDSWLETNLVVFPAIDSLCTALFLEIDGRQQNQIL